ncbi:MAG: SDR family oxidoreductase [Rhodospirillales bacterium]
MDVRLDGRTALITGGSRGLGKGMAHKFADSGAQVAFVARRADVLEEAATEIKQATSADVRGYACDVGDKASLEKMFGKVIKDFGKVDILVNNAGASTRAPFIEITDEMWEADFELKVYAAIRLIRLAVPGMKDRNWGRVINILNSRAKAPQPGGAPTAVTRATGLAMTKVLAGEVAKHNVLVNALCTGIIVTDQIARRYEKEQPNISFEEYVANAGKAVPMGRMGTTEEYASMACFLASDAAAYITGCAINVDGGLSPMY